MLVLCVGVQCFYVQLLSVNDMLKNKFFVVLLFKLMGVQVCVVVEIECDMVLDVLMMCLVQGDVGFGKMLVVVFVVLCVIVYGKQVVLMVLIELFVEQYVNNFCNWFVLFGIEVGWFVGKQKGKVWLVQQEVIVSGQVQMIVGIYVIFQEQVQFNGLVLVIIDEQYCFGVYQCLVLWEKGQQQGFYLYQLIMIVMLIFCMLVMIVYVDFDILVIDELLSGCMLVIMVVIFDICCIDIIDCVYYVCIIEGCQVYWVCMLIEELELLEVQVVEVIWEELKLVLLELNVGLVYGWMKFVEKQVVMVLFK